MPCLYGQALHGSSFDRGVSVRLHNGRALAGPTGVRPAIRRKPSMSVKLNKRQYMGPWVSYYQSSGPIYRSGLEYCGETSAYAVCFTAKKLFW